MVMMFIMIFMIFLPFILAVFLLKHFSHDQLPPGPNLWEILRNISIFINSPHIAFKNFSKIYGPLISIRIGGQLVVVASSQATAKDILKNQSFSGRFFPSLYYSIPGTIHFSVVSAKQCNDTWKYLRAIGQTYLFSSKAIESNALIRKTKAMEMVNYLRMKGGEIVNIENVIFATLSNISSNILASRNLFSIDLESIADRKLVNFIRELVEKAITSPGLSDLFPILEKIDFWTKRKAIDMASNRPRDSGQDLFDVLAENACSDDQIASLLMEFLTAGTYTTTIVIVSLMVQLMKNQEIIRRIRDEVLNQAFDGDVINDSRLSECQYLQACIKETLRLHTPGEFIIPHRAIETCKLNNYTIPKGMVMLVTSWALHSDPSDWEDPESFKPERFLGTDIDFMGGHFQFLPFSSGQRMCPGAVVAVKSVQLMVAYLLHYFDWNITDGVNYSNTDKMYKFTTTSKKEKPLCLIPKMREQQMSG